MTANRRFARARLGGVVLVAAVCVIAGGQFAFAEREVARGIWLLVAGVAAAGAASRLLPYLHGVASPPPALGRGEWAFLAAVTGGAAVLRFVALGRLPPGAFFDEAQNVLVAGNLLRGHPVAYIGDFTQMPAFFFYLLAGAVATLGKSIVAARCLSALLGTATVPLFYMLARRFSPGIAAVASAILLACSRWHVNFSRIGFTGALCPLIEILALLALLRALERSRRRDWILLGAALAVGLQSYYAFNLFPAVLAVAAAAFLLLAPRAAQRLARRRLLSGLAWATLTAAVLLAPLGAYALGHPDEFLRRSSTVAIWNPDFHLPFAQTLGRHTRAHLLMFNWQGDWNPRHNITDSPLLTSIEGVLLALGIGLAIGRVMRPPQAVALAWFAVMLLPGILTIEAPQAYRTIGVIPAVYLLIAQAFEAVPRLVTGWPPWRGPSWPLGAALVTLTVATGAQNVATYFALQMTDPRAWTAFEADYTEVAKTIKEEGKGHRVWVDPVYFDHPVVRLHLGDDFRYDRFVLSEHFPPGAAGRAVAPQGELFVLEGFEKDLIPLYRRVFPGAVAREHLDPFGRVMFVTVAVPGGGDRPPDRSLAERGYLAAFYPGGGWIGNPALFRRDPAVFFHFHWERDGLAGPFVADWAARLHVGSAGEYAFELLASGPSLVLLDGRTVVAQTRTENEETVRATVPLEAGDHVLFVRYRRAGYASTVRFWWQPPGAAHSAVIPLDDLTAPSPDEYLRLAPSLPLPPPATPE